MIRTSKHTIKFANRQKQIQLESVVKDYKIALQEYVDLILNERLPFKKHLSTKDLPEFKSVNFKHSQWKIVVYQNASSIIKTNFTKIRKKVFKRYQYLYAKSLKQNKHSYFLNKKYNELNINYLKRIGKIKIKNVKVDLVSNLFNIKETNSKEFNEFVRIRLPYRDESKRQSKGINIPIKHHKQSNKFKNSGWLRKNTIGFDGKNIIFYWEKEEKPKTERNVKIGIDIGYKKLISTSTQNHYGRELVCVYESLARKKVGSVNFKQTLIERDKLINQFCNEFYKKEDFDILFIEDLKNVKRNSKINTKFMNKLQRWTYPKVISKLEMLSEEKGFHLNKVSPAYTSQRCSQCRVINKSNRKGESYQCTCGIKMDADTNAALNILHRGVYNPSVTRRQEIEL